MIIKTHFIICRTGVADAVGVAGDQGTIDGRRACDVIEVLEVAPATASVLALPSSSRIFMAPGPEPGRQLS
jgi:succinyl-CoA synthetase alpha subunit